MVFGILGNIGIKKVKPQRVVRQVGLGKQAKSQVNPVFLRNLALKERFLYPGTIVHARPGDAAKAANAKMIRSFVRPGPCGPGKSRLRLVRSLLQG